MAQGAQAAGGTSAVERVRTALVEWDDALHRARKDLEGARSVAAAWDTEVVTTRAHLQQGRAALEETEGLKMALADKAAVLTAVEDNSSRSELHAKRRKASFSGSGLLSSRPGLRLSRST
jgi:hypothetical protein